MHVHVCVCMFPHVLNREHGAPCRRSMRLRAPASSCGVARHWRVAAAQRVSLSRHPDGEGVQTY